MAPVTVGHVPPSRGCTRLGGNAAVPAAADLLLAALALALLAACWTDLKARTIPNPLNGAIAIGAPLFWWAEGLPAWPDGALRAAAALVLFGLFVIPWLMRAMGGGDVKLIGALALWLPPLDAVRMLVVMSIAGGAVTLLTLADHRLRRRAGPVEVPYGVAIGFAGLWMITQRYLYQFG
jgi:prepilin peptidase CpaA